MGCEHMEGQSGLGCDCGDVVITGPSPLFDRAYEIRYCMEDAWRAAKSHARHLMGMPITDREATISRQLAWRYICEALCWRARVLAEGGAL